jgi:hypothetical protein
MTVAALQRRTAAAGAVLLVLGFLTGVLLAQAMTHHIDADLHQILAAHFIAVLGCLWLVALALTLPMLRYGEVGRRRVVLVTAIPAYGNWGVTAVKSFFHVSGVGLNGDHANDVVFGALSALVVIPSFVAALAWAYGLLGARPSDTSND